jgi:hypothetical protein
MFIYCCRFLTNAGGKERLLKLGTWGCGYSIHSIKKVEDHRAERRRLIGASRVGYILPMLGLVQMTTPIVQLLHLLRSVGLRELFASQSHTARCTLSHSFVIGRMETVWRAVIRLNGDVVVRLLSCSPIRPAMLGAGVFAQSFELGFESYGTPFRRGRSGRFQGAIGIRLQSTSPI